MQAKTGTNPQGNTGLGLPKPRQVWPWSMVSTALRLRGPLNIPILETAISALERRYDCLRTTFASTDGTGARRVQLPQQKFLNVKEIALNPSGALKQVLKSEQKASFDLETTPGWRTSIYCIDNADHVLIYSAATRNENPLHPIELGGTSAMDCAALQDGPDEMCRAKQLQFWKTQLEGSRPAALLLDIPRPAALSGETDMETISTHDGLWTQLQQFCQQQQTTPFVVLLAAFRIAHYRMSGASDAVIASLNDPDDQGTQSARIKNLEMMDYFRIKIEDRISFQEVVSQVHAINSEIEDSARPQIPPEQVTNSLRQADKDLSRDPIARMLLNVHSQTELHRYVFEGTQSEDLSMSNGSLFDIELHIYPKDTSLKVEVLFATDLFKPETIKSMLSIFYRVVDHGVNTPDTPVETLDLMTRDDYDVLNRMDLISLQTTTYPRGSTVVDVFRQQAKETPDFIAVKDASSQLTYAELDKQSDTIALWLRRQNLPSEALVGVFAARSCQVIITFIGVLKACLAYLPFDTKTPHDRMKTILSSIKGRTIVLVGSVVPVPTFESDAQFIKISDILENSARAPGPLQESSTYENITATNLAYVMFTSGSTGRPKGVMVEHRGIVRLVKGCNMAEHLPRHTIMAHLTSIAFDNSTWEIYAPLLTGGTLVCIDAATVLDCSAVAEIFIREKVQSAMLTPALLKQYLIGCPDAIAAMEMMCIQGEKANVEDMFLAHQLSGGTVINAYGPTENTVTSSFFVLRNLEPCTNGVPIGRPISNSGAHIMDSKQRLVPLGVIGELVVTGDGLARGYDDPERNLDRFISITVNHCKIPAYRTGDYVRHRPTDGQLEFFGRIDGQVKIHGNRIELGEIEHVIRSHQHVSDAVVVVQSDSQDPRLAAYLTLREVRPGSIEESTLVEAWLDHWDVKTYTPIDKIQLQDFGRDFIGWTSMHDGSDIPRNEMNEWLDETIDTILDGGPAGHILEIGTGSGMILFNLNNGLESYVGLEPSGKAVDFVSQAATLMPNFVDKVTMRQGTAGDIDQLNITNSPDTAILNSVIQYFPSQDYLLRVIRDLINVGAKKIFLGDVRSHALYREFLAARALFIAGDSHISPQEFRRIMADIEKAESELLLDPAFFTSLPGRLSNIDHVEILPKRIHAVNELSCYRYNAVLHIKQEHAQTSVQSLRIGQATWIDFNSEDFNRKSLSHLLSNSHGSALVVVENIPDSKTSLERSVIELLNTFEQSADVGADEKWLNRAHQQASLRPCMSTTDLIMLAQQTGWQIELSWARQRTQNGGMDAVFYRGHQAPGSSGRVKFRFPVEDHGRLYSSLSSHPLRREVRRKVQDQLHRLLQNKLPSYMIPQFFTFLDKLPVNQNSKVDRKAIATYFQRQEVMQGQSQESMSAAERKMRDIWSRVLSIDSCTINKNNSFFNLGGDSIAAMMVVNESRNVGIKIAVADIFRWPVLHELTSNTGTIADHSTGVIGPFALLGDDIDAPSLIKEVSTCCGLNPDAIEDIFPCTPLQEGLIFETLRRPGDYLRQAVIRLSHGISKKRLVRTWERVIRAKPILRTRVIQHDQLGLLQVVSDEQVDWIDASAIGLQTYLDVDKQKSMGLGQPLSRYALLEDELGVPQWLVWSAHHALYDGWSLHLLQNTLYKAYDSDGTRIEPGPQFQSFIKYVKDVGTDESSKYWQRVLLDCKHSPFPSLPPTIEHPIADTIIKDSIPLPPNSGIDITTSILIRAAWGLVMGQMTNSDDVVYGMTLYGRNAPVAELDKMAAPTISTVPIRVQIDKSQRCTDFLAKLQAEATEMIPFEQTGLQNIIKSVRSSQYSCKFQTQLVVQTGADHCNECPFGEWQQGSEEQGFITYAFTLELWLHSDRIATTAMFDSRAIEPWLVRHMVARLSAVMDQLTKALPTQTLSDLEICVPEDLNQIWEWNEAVPTAIEECVHDIFQKQVQVNPDAPAIVAWDGHLTYGQLDELSHRVAEKLISLGVEGEVVVPVCFEKSMWTVVAILGVIKAGGGFVMLDPTLPELRLKEIVQQVEGKVVLSSPLNKGLTSRLVKETVTLDWSFFDDPEVQSDSFNSGKRASPSSILYVIFTSGSTGTPKGVMITHQNLSSALHHQVELLGLTSTSRLYDFASYNFDVSISNIFTVLAAGAALCIPTDEERRNNLEGSISASGANALDLTPCVAQLLSPSRLPQVRSLVLGGEALHVSEIRQWWDIGNVRIRNAYGPCECTPTSVINYSATTLEATTQIGKGAGVVTWIVNPEDHNQLLPPGCTGELLLEGPIVGRGYLNDPAKTATYFIEDPVWLLRGAPGKPGRRGRLYKTGDLVKYNENGSLTYVCRKDDQVKVRGQRVELGEIEHALRSQEYIDEAVAILQGESKENAQIASFVTIHDEVAAQEDQLEDHEESEQQIKSWEVQFDGDTYSSMEMIQTHEIGRDFVGWSSMIDGEEFDLQDMNEWLDDTLKCILNGRNSIGNVLEIGTGSGMILFNLAHALRSYIGLEPSEKAVDFLARSVARLPQLKDKVKIFKGTAADISRLASTTTILPDIVVINSVLQYFPSQEYLLDVIRDIIHLGSAKTIFFGDVRSHALHKEFLAMRAIHSQKDVSQQDLRRIILNMQKSEPELLVDPGFFTGLSDRLPGHIDHVEILPKIMAATNELSCYRYAAVVHLASANVQHTIRHISEDNWIDFNAQKLDHQLIETLLDPISAPDTLAISNIPYSKIAFPRAILDAVENAELDNQRSSNWLSISSESAEYCNSLSPMDIVELAHRADYRVELSWARQSSQLGGLDAVFYRYNGPDDESERTLYCFPHDHLGREYQSLSSRPLRQRIEGKIRQKLNKKLESLLPRYMVPHSITILDRMPISRNGKVNRRMLAESCQTQNKTHDIKQQPTTAMQREMQKIWSEVLNVKPHLIGLHDGFLQLGGNSLDAMRVVTMARQAGMNLTVTDMFSHAITSIHQLTRQLMHTENFEVHESPVQKIDSTYLLEDIARYDAQIAAARLDVDKDPGVDNHIARHPTGKLPTVLLTGANGFIGTQILRQLLEHNQVGRVIAVVRGESTETAKKRLVDAAKKALWWSAFHDAILEVWAGDLSMPHLGLDSIKWDLITKGTVDIIIHNGASVHFMKSYEVLRPTNVASTVEMLCVTASNRGTRFVYVSSARHEDPMEEDEERVARYLAANSNGYSQTKFVAETLVRRAASRSAYGPKQFTVVSPGLVIGTLTEGGSNTDDWIWRLTSACIRVGMFNADNSETWIPISEVGTTARIIVDTALSSSGSSQSIVQIKGGLTLGEFWKTLVTMGYELEARNGSECAAAIRGDIESSKESHPLWALSDILEDLEETAQNVWAASWREERASSIRLQVAIERSVRYLTQVGFLLPTMGSPL
ncbi:hypothetical protein FOXB_16587 [Fusarium oxysporum f. sp. conglutinans Fo5176]|uniref:Carrier domain-containing protein n=1 Tax=Fusarium oxysporum (strain Fo5176) TaxID=660025 RepID=F9GD53_FUSOF|nr:hypothetical protein FOXB_16587 [Fusarium oxysporum f. sp. conglutinans Fo5176]